MCSILIAQRMLLLSLMLTMHEHVRITTRIVLVRPRCCEERDIISQLPEITLKTAAYRHDLL